MTTTEELNAKRVDLISKKSEITKSIVSINQQLISTLPHREYARVMRTKNDLVRQLQEIESQIADVNSRRHMAAKSEKQEGGDNDKSHVRKLAELRDEYQAFAADATRSPTMRRMASEFVVRLNPIIRQALSKAD